MSSQTSRTTTCGIFYVCFFLCFGTGAVFESVVVWFFIEPLGSPQFGGVPFYHLISIFCRSLVFGFGAGPFLLVALPWLSASNARARWRHNTVGPAGAQGICSCRPLQLALSGLQRLRCKSVFADLSYDNLRHILCVIFWCFGMVAVFESVVA